MLGDEAAALYERAMTGLMKHSMLLYFAYADFEEVTKNVCEALTPKTILSGFDTFCLSVNILNHSSATDSKRRKAMWNKNFFLYHHQSIYSFSNFMC